MLNPMERRFQFSLRVLAVWAVALPASVLSVVSGIRTNNGCGFLVAMLWLAFFVWVAIRQTRNPAHVMLGFLAFLFLWPLWLMPALILLAAGGLIDLD